MNTPLETVIGLEVHVQLNTESKMFCSCRNESDAQEPNTHICPVCMGVVGSIPLINKKAVEHTIRTGLALQCSIPRHSKWDRKNYFYPDLPKGYQISQYDLPLASRGRVEIVNADGNIKIIGINRVHLEEDAAKLVHTDTQTLVDFNRSSAPLMEVVTEPDMRSVEEAEGFLRELRRIVRYIGVSHADMEKGHLRCDASISLRPTGETKLYPRTEIKNLNSFKSVARALHHEYEKQLAAWEQGNVAEGAITVLWDEDKGETRFMRGKEDAADYRYVPEPDIPELEIDESRVREMRAALPVLPTARLKRYLAEGIGQVMAHTVLENAERAQFLDSLLATTEHEKALQKLAIKSFFGIFPALNVSPENLLQVVKALYAGSISSLAAKDILDRIKQGPVDVDQALSEFTGTRSASDLEATILDVMSNNQKIVEEYKSGKEKVINVLIGKVVQACGKSASPGEIHQLLIKNLTHENAR